jgi:sarcosine oxidase subunit alpha
VPPESSQIVEQGETRQSGRARAGTARIVGRITSSRFSPTLGRSICLGFVASHLATPGSIVTVWLPDGRPVPATVMPQLAHVDPDGSRLRV